MASKKASSSKKKKGLKGKKARAKAKLERQWGEEVVAEPGIRKGNSRLLTTTHNEEPDNIKEDATSEPVSAREQVVEHGASSDEEEDGTTSAYSSLLKSLRQSKGATSDDDDADEMDGSDEESVGEAFKEKKDDESSNAAVTDISLVDDPFIRHFYPKSGDTVQRDDAVTKLSSDLTAGTDPYHEVHASAHWLSHIESSSLLTSSQVGNWSLASRAYWENMLGRFRIDDKIMSNAQKLLLPPIASYADLLCTAIAEKTTRRRVQQLLAMHIAQHVLTSRTRILRNNKKKETDDAPSRDQGYTRPTVLILLPTRGVCYAFVQMLLNIFGLDSDDAKVEHIDRFRSEYGPLTVTENMDAASKQRRRAVLTQKGTEWNKLFGDEANDDDDFRIGLSVQSRKDRTAVKLFADFFKSDIILASPLSLKITSEEDDVNVDFLSSIEICLLWRAEVLLMQNWDHVVDVMELLNQQPRETTHTDFSRVRNYFLDGEAAQYRQLIMTAPFSDPLMLSTFRRFAQSWAGLVRIRRRCPSEEASITKILLPTRQVFQRIPCSSFATQSADRLKYFEEKVVPQLENQKHTLIFIPSYFDFVAVRNLFLKQELIFVSVTEYARTSEVSRGRARFLQGRKPIMLYTGRAHFFHRHVIKGARHVIFYGLPEHAYFYSDHVTALNEGLEKTAHVEDMDDVAAATNSSLALFTKYESHALERIVGSANCSRMVKSEKSTFLFSA